MQSLLVLALVLRKYCCWFLSFFVVNSFSYLWSISYSPKQTYLQLARDHRLLVEPACGAALAALYSDRLRHELGLTPPQFGSITAGDDEEDENQSDDLGPIIVIVCGGSGVNLELLQQWKAKFHL